ncbi:cdc25-like protein phosphatase twine [Drosophila grimshawi]|uniref:protein-tyrosine-phosphatase n=1 Tax=Drosophila grimshawi TaxID=7222 RepID=B4JLP3_DROGR|nr:cdc25-like protein phosphatase twine [Drosophila grimshawi]XP_032594825.1 cdc25-like protein phosphatase twine [Drosophila grimshawi]EDV91654.1 GH24474 [Drosophila grimshawi]
MERKDLKQQLEEDNVIIEDANANKSGKATLPSDPDTLVTGRLKTKRPKRPRMSATTTIKKSDADVLNVAQLTGDLSKPLTLPVLHGGMRNSDLPTISSATLARLLRGDFFKLVSNNYQIIDCRYPYEFHGGHIRGARNLYTHDQIRAAFPAEASIVARNSIYVFHCEFSSHRAPTLMRFLRTTDRNAHTDDYPLLDYPELYLLYKGYKEFHTSYTNLCNPNNYVPMLAPEYTKECTLFYGKTKPKNCGDNCAVSLKRARFLLEPRSRPLFDDSNLEPAHKSKKY